MESRKRAPDSADPQLMLRTSLRKITLPGELDEAKDSTDLAL